MDRNASAKPLNVSGNAHGGRRAVEPEMPAPSSKPRLAPNDLVAQAYSLLAKQNSAQGTRETADWRQALRALGEAGVGGPAGTLIDRAGGPHLPGIPIDVQPFSATRAPAGLGPGQIVGRPGDLASRVMPALPVDPGSRHLAATRGDLQSPPVICTSNSARSRQLAGIDGDDRRSADYGTRVDARPQTIERRLEQRILSDGSKCDLPIRYYDVQCLVATFLTEPDRAAALLTGTPLQAVVQEDGKAVVVVYCIEYRMTDIGPYNEVGLTILAAALGDPVPANYVVDLPVTTVVANRAGREIWGYNKFVAGIDVRSDVERFTTILRDTEHQLIASVEGSRGVSVPAPPVDILTFTMLKGRLVKTVIQVLTPYQASRGENLVPRVGNSNHPMTSHLRALALDGARPVLVHYADPFQSLLFPGRTV
jgi:Acetoacetate decarboxylase (ADC)